MKSKYRKLGEFIRQIDMRNVDGKEDNLLGVSVQKLFIPSIANTVGTDFIKYKIVKKGQFTYIPDTSRRGDKIGIALLEDYEEGLVSNVYTVFEVIDEKRLLPKYLMLWFSRQEFDRYARFKSHGSVREVMDWEEMCNVELPVPTYEEQCKIVEAYKIVEDRIKLKRKINDKLMSHPEFIYDSTGKITGYKTPGGADTVFPFKKLYTGSMYITANSQATVNHHFTAEIDDITLFAGYIAGAGYNLCLYIKGVGSVAANFPITVNGNQVTLSNRIQSGTCHFYYF